MQRFRLADETSSSSMLAKISSIRLFSVVEVVVGLNPGGRNWEMSSCWIVENTLRGSFLFPVLGGPFGLNPAGSKEEGTPESSTGMLAKI